MSFYEPIQGQSDHYGETSQYLRAGFYLMEELAFNGLTLHNFWRTKSLGTAKYPAK